MAAMQTTMIRASMTAYSTAVGPSSLMKLTIFWKGYALRGTPGCDMENICINLAATVATATSNSIQPVNVRQRNSSRDLYRPQEMGESDGW